MTRRQFTQSGSVAVALGSLTGAHSVAYAKEEALAIETLDLNTPADNLNAFVKVRDSLSAERTLSVVTGRVYGVIEGQKAEPFFGLLGFQVSRTKRLSETTFRQASQYFALYTELKTGRRARSLANPFTDRVIEPPISQYGPSTTIITPSTMLPGTQDPSNTHSESAIRPWARIGNKLRMTDEVAVPLPDSRQPDLDLTTYYANWDDVQNPDLTSVPSTMSFTAVEHWRDWMAMGSIQGSLLWHVTGHKLANGETLPAHLVSQALKETPEMLDETRPVITE